MIEAKENSCTRGPSTLSAPCVVNDLEYPRYHGYSNAEDANTPSSQSEMFRKKALGYRLQVTITWQLHWSDAQHEVLRYLVYTLLHYVHCAVPNNSFPVAGDCCD